MMIIFTGEAMSHFRLTDELDWGENETSVDRTEPHSDFVLSLDPQDIARSLSCLPVHTVLGIPQNMVTVSYQVHLFLTCSRRFTSDIFGPFCQMALFIE